MKLDILVLAAHPDDAELGCGATMAKHVAKGLKVGVLDFTRGELGTRGTAQLRDDEAQHSAAILGLSVRDNLGFRDGFFVNDEYHQRKLITYIRRYRPDIVLANAVSDRHPDHGRAAELAVEACFLSGLSKIESEDVGVQQAPWRPRALYHYIQSLPLMPDFVVDVSSYWDKKQAAVRAFKSQFYDPQSIEPATYISDSNFLAMVDARGLELGQSIGVSYGEGFMVRRRIGVGFLTDIDPA